MPPSIDAGVRPDSGNLEKRYSSIEASLIEQELGAIYANNQKMSYTQPFTSPNA